MAQITWATSPLPAVPCALRPGAFPRDRPPEECLPSCCRFSCCRLEGSWTRDWAPATIWTLGPRLSTVQTWGPQGPSLTTRHQPSPGSSPPSSQEKPCPPSRCQSPIQIPEPVAEWPKVPSSQAKYSAMLGARECPALCANSVPEAKRNPGNPLPRLPGPCLHLPVIRGSSQHLWW